uniref:Protein farnesyltransferase subunit beta n=1 Tax=Steinernema glaseri TaxID=37863 RepID=A0A1I8AJ98_9BILA
MATVFDSRFLFDDDGVKTETSEQQKKVEKMVREEYDRFLKRANSEMDEPDAQLSPKLLKTVHSHYLLSSLERLSITYSTLDSSRSWMCYWALHSLRLLNCDVPCELKSRIVKFLETCKTSEGGYAGGPGQIAHLATTYAAVMALVTINTDEALASIDRKGLRRFILSVKNVDGSYALHKDGETDMRGAYCALAVAAITNMLDDEIASNTADWITTCQTYEGGFGSGSSCEAHGGYTFCAMASLALLGKTNRVYIPTLLKWLTNKQMRYEGGFQGRSNKLVDGCYSYWQAAIFPLVEYTLKNENHWKDDYEKHFELFDWKALQMYTLVACQDPAGGLRDKPDKSRDLYHTCYTLSGLSIAQDYATAEDPNIGDGYNYLNRINSVFNVCVDAEHRAKEYFSNLDDKL